MSYNGPVVWVWNFGDGYGSTSRNPTHEYVHSGIFTVTLTVYDIDARSSQATTTIDILLGPDNTFDETEDGWDIWITDDLTLGVSAAGFIVSGGIMFLTGVYFPSMPIITSKGRKVLGILMIFVGVYFFVFIDNAWLG